MKRLLLIVAFVLLSLPASAFGKGVELNIKGIRVGSLQKTVIAQLGKPVKTEQGTTNECVGAKEMTLRYDGLSLYLLSDEKGRNFRVSSITATSPKWLVAPGINVGVTRKAVEAKFGKPSSRDNEEGAERWFYNVKDDLSWTSFIFKNGKLVEINQSEVLC